MDCTFCSRTANDDHSLLCPTCARSSIYNLRIDLATSLLDREEASKRVAAVQTGDITTVPATLTLDGAILDLRDCHVAKEIERKDMEACLITDQIDSINDKMEKLRAEVVQMKKLLAEKKATAVRKLSDNESAKYGLKQGSMADIEAIQKVIRQTKRQWDLDHTNMIQGRISLCRNTARLYTLRKHKMVEGQTIQEHFEIARGLQIFDLRELNRADPELLTASLTQVAYLVSRISTYLALRPPSEIQLPHKDHPHATMFSLNSSYINKDFSSTPNQSTTSSPSASKLLSQRVATPRPLYISRPLPKLYKEDPHAFSLFTEGVALLAWNVAWLCKSQGSSGFSSWIDICDVGRNLWQLLMADHRGPYKSASEREKQASVSTTGDDAVGSRGPTHFGVYSHASAHSFFGKECTDLQRAWKLQTPTKAIDEIKAHLVQEMQGAEWELLEGQELVRAKEAMKVDEDPVLVGGRRWSAVKKERDATAAKGTSGWTRLRLRSDAQKSDIPSSLKGSTADEAITE